MDEKKEQKLFGERLKKLRLGVGFTQQVAAVSAGLSIGGYCKIEQGKADPGWSTVLRLAKLFGVDVGVFTHQKAR